MQRRDFCLSAAAAAAVTSARTTGFAGPIDPGAQLSAALDQFYATSLQEEPELATALGIDNGPRAAAKSMLHDASVAAKERRARINAGQLAALQAIDRSRLSAASASHYDAVLYDRSAKDRANRRFAYGEGAGAPYVISQIDGSYGVIPDFLASDHTIATPDDCEAYLARLDGFARLLDQEGERVRRDAGLGVIAPDFAIAGALAQTKLLQVPADRSTLVSSLAARARGAHIAGDWAARAGTIHARRILPALDRQIGLLQTLQPRAVHDAGVWRLPDGDAYYAESLRTSLTSDLAPDDVHRLGLDLTRELTGRAETLFGQIGIATGPIADRFAALFRDPRYLYPDSDAGRASEIAALNDLVADMEQRLPAYFATLPKATLAIRRIPHETEASQSTHYSGGSTDGSRPGIYWLNMRDMREVSFFDMPTTTFHEGVPGHHLQGMLQLQSNLPDACKILFFNAYIEGWALYAEQLALEMGVYDGHPAWQLGYVHDALLRAGRLVVDTGMHAQRWPREQAIAVLHATCGDSPALCAQEIERYACWPGQACGYMVGKVTILRLRDRARLALGARFDIRAFHDAVLLSGATPLALLEARIDSFIAEAKGKG